MKKMDRDVVALGAILRGCADSNPKMVGANLRFAWDKFVLHGDKEKCCDNGFLGGRHECQKSECK